jgi:hypothetical protein
MYEQQRFSKFPKLPTELQVAIIEHALDETIRQRDNKLPVHYQLETGFDKKHQSAIYRRVQLPKIPALYHVDRLFRAEAIRAQPPRQLFDVAFEKQPPRSKRRHPCGSMVVFNPAHDVLEIMFQDTRSDARTDQRLEFLFQLMSHDFMASTQHMIIIQRVHDVSCAYELITKALCDLRFATLSKASIRSFFGRDYRTSGASESIDDEFKLMDSGGICAYREGRVVSFWHFSGPATVEKLAQKRRLLEQAQG